MSYAKRHMWAALDALGVAPEEEGYPFEAMEDDPNREGQEGHDCGAPIAETLCDGIEGGAPGMEGQCSSVDGQEPIDQKAQGSTPDEH